MSDVLVRVAGACGRITLNRPRAINALTPEMTGTMYTALMAWASDPSIHFVLLDGAGERGLCAGGDVRAMYHAVVAGQPHIPEAFFRDEYRLNYFISRYPKPYVALMEGIVMGGGIGVSAHGSHRIVTERSELAMPETAIGFIPDVGGTYLLGTAPDECGTYLGLTGNRIGAADALYCRLADLIVPSERLAALTADLEKCADTAAMEDCLRDYATQAPTQGTLEPQAWIAECFAYGTIEDIFAALDRHTDPRAHLALKELGTKSPTSLKVTLSALRNGRESNDLAACLQQEYRIAQVCLKEHDFTEGVRAALVDKDRNPKWRPERLEEVTPEDVRRYFSLEGIQKLDLASPLEQSILHQANC